jgi:hypothetical protein
MQHYDVASEPPRGCKDFACGEWKGANATVRPKCCVIVFGKIESSAAPREWRCFLAGPASRGQGSPVAGRSFLLTPFSRFEQLLGEPADVAIFENVVRALPQTVRINLCCDPFPRLFFRKFASHLLASVHRRDEFHIEAVKNSCPSGSWQLTPKTSCEIGVVFAPATIGVKSAQMLIVDDAAGSPHSIELSGTSFAL